MTLKEFKNKIVDIAADSDYSHQYRELGRKKSFHISYPNDWEPTYSWGTYDEKKNVIQAEWETGGVSGGSCWDSSNPREYTSDNDPEELTLLDCILESIKPDITFLEYRQLEKAVIKSTSRTECEYYGNRTDYKSLTVEIEDLYNYMNKKGWLSK